MVQLAKSYENIRAAGAELWAISPQGIVQNQILRDRYDLPFPILADDDQAVIREWGIFNDLDAKQRPIPYPATYIIDQAGRIRWFFLGLRARERPTVGEIVAAVKTLVEENK